MQFGVTVLKSLEQLSQEEIIFDYFSKKFLCNLVFIVVVYEVYC